MKTLGTVAMFFLTLGFGCGSQLPWNTSSPADAEVAADQLEISLAQTAERLLAGIRDGQPEEFLALCSRDTVELGVDNELSYEQVRAAFARRAPLYCQYFETACLQEYLGEIKFEPAEDLEGKLPLPVSYRELLDEISGMKVSDVKIKNVKPLGTAGTLTVRWDSPPPRHFGYATYLRLAFVLEEGEWRLISDSTR